MASSPNAPVRSTSAPASAIAAANAREVVWAKMLGIHSRAGEIHEKMRELEIERMELEKEFYDLDQEYIRLGWEYAEAMVADLKGGTK